MAAPFSASLQSPIRDGGNINQATGRGAADVLTVIETVLGRLLTSAYWAHGYSGAILLPFAIERVAAQD